ncbi:acetyl-CoA synthetase-like protein [Apiospora rasikravindrae]|uniref:Acetyl-CoA synthetase-like protein n=1 Tax=Apiospora rasikravindrae TaxID=990691 RepID=A0ABR1TD47_9PEZI
MTYATLTPIFRGGGGDGQAQVSNSIESLKLSFSIALHHFYDTDEYVVFREGVHLSGITHQNGEVRTKKGRGIDERITYNPHMDQNVSCSEALENSFSSSGGDMDVGPLTSSTNGEKGASPTSTPYLMVINYDSPAQANNETQYDDVGYSLLVYVQCTQQAQKASLRYNESTYSDFQMRGLARTLETSVRALVEKPLSPVSSLELAGDEDCQMIGDWNREPTIAEKACLHRLAERTARTRPDEPAIVSWDGTLSYRELDSLAGKLASHLSTRYNIGPGKAVPLCFEKSLYMVVAMLGVLKAGGAYCCLDPAHPRARHEYIIRSVNASLIIASPHQAHLFQGISDVLALDAQVLDALPPTSEGISFSCDTVGPDDTCMIAFTSGSTGVPKGIVHTHSTVELRKNLPEFMVPRIFYPMEEFPYNASRKLDRKALREFGSSLTIEALMQPNAAAAAVTNGTTQQHQADLTPAEHCFQKLWATLLHVEQSEIKLDDNFFALGGSSLSAIRLIASARDAGYSITYTAIFKSPTLREVARSAIPKVEQQSGAVIEPFALVREDRRSAVFEAASTQCAIPAADIADVFPITPQQEGLWALSLASDGNDGSYIAHFTIRLREATGVAKFCTAWETVANSVAFMRSRFMQSDVGAHQVVLKRAVTWKEGASVQSFVRSELNEPVDFGKPVTSYGLIRGEPTLKPALGFSNNLVVWKSHHGLYDGHSIVLFLNAVAQVYRGEAFGSEIPSTRFIHHLQTMDEGACRNFWRSRYDGGKAATNFPKIPYPTYRPRPSGFYRRSIVFQQPEHSRITKANVLRAALALTIAQVTGASHVNFLETLDGRSVAVPGVESIIGPTFNTVPRNTAVDLGLTVEQFLLRMQDTSTEMMPFSLYGLQKISTLSPQCASACEFQSLLVIEPTYLREYIDVFDFDETGGGIHRFTSDCILWKCDMHDNGVELATSFDEHVIDAKELRWVVNLFEENLYFLCSREQTLPLSANPATLIASHAFANKVASNGVATAPEPTATNGTTPALLSGTSGQVSELLKKAWINTLGMEEEEFSLTDDFFLKGGNSIRAMEFVAAARALGISITVAKVFQNPSFHALVKVATLQNIERDDESLPFSLLGPQYNKDELIRLAAMQCDINPSEIEDILPATSLQAEFMASSAGKKGAWMAQTQYTFPRNISVEMIRAIWNKLHEHYRTLRTRLVQTPSGVYQVVTRSPPLWFVFDDPSIYMNTDREMTMKYGDALTRYAIGPLAATDGERRTIFTMHHSIYDGFTLDKLLHALSQAMQGRQLLPAPTSTLFMQHIASTDEAAAKTFWQRYLSGYAGRDAFPPRASASHVPEANRTLKIGIKLPTHREWPSITLPTIILGAWALVVGHYSGETEDVAFGTRVSGRSAPVQSIMDMLEPTIAHVPVRVKISRDQSVENFLHHLQIEQSEVMAYEQTGLAKIAAYDEHCRAACSFQNMLVIQRPSGEVVGELGQRFGVYEELSDYQYFNDWALLVDVFPSLAGDGAQLVFCYDSAILGDGRIREMAQRLERAIALLASSKDGIAGTTEAIGSDIDL